MLLLFNAIECNIEETLLGVENDKYFIFVNQSEKLLKTVDNELMAECEMQIFLSSY